MAGRKSYQDPNSYHGLFIAFSVLFCQKEGFGTVLNPYWVYSYVILLS
jgi:hypothetical protein